MDSSPRGSVINKAIKRGPTPPRPQKNQTKKTKKKKKKAVVCESTFTSSLVGSRGCTRRRLRMAGFL